MADKQCFHCAFRMKHEGSAVTGQLFVRDPESLRPWNFTVTLCRKCVRELLEAQVLRG